MAAGSVIAPEEEIALEKKTLKTEKPQIDPKIEPKPAGPNNRTPALLYGVFEGHEEFLGWTPD